MVQGPIEVVLCLALPKWELVWRPRAAASALPFPLPLPSLLHQAEAVGVVLDSQLPSHCRHGKPRPHLWQSVFVFVFKCNCK